MSAFSLNRERVDLAGLAGRYTDLRRSGASLRGLCPLPGHDDTQPSFYVYPDDHFHCYGCGSHGDVTDFWAREKGLQPGFEAALDLAREYRIDVPEMDPDARARAQQRREKEDRMFGQARQCHETLSQQPAVVAWWEKRGFGRELQKRFLLGATEDGTAATVPFWYRGRVHGQVQRKLSGEPRYLYPRVEDFAGGYRPLFIPGPVREGTLVVEGPVDALAVAALGESVVAVGGTDASQAQVEELSALPGLVYVLFDDDEAGKKAARELARGLYPNALLCAPEYGEGRKDVADLFAAEGPRAGEVLERLKARAADALDWAIEGIPKELSVRGKLERVRQDVVPLLLKALEAKGITALVRPMQDSDTLAATGDVAQKTGLKPPVLKAVMEEEAPRWVAEMLTKARAGAEAEAAANAVPEEVYAPLLRPGVLDRYAENAALVHGVVGDEEAMKLISLVAFGAQLALLPNGKPLGPSLMLIAEAGRGKNYLTDAVISLLPPGWYLGFESASSASMYYQVERDKAFLEHRFVYPNEVEATDMLVEFLRPMLSAGKAVRLTVNSTGAHGANEGQEFEVRGPITTVIPTVRNKLDDQLQTRLLVAELEDYEGRVRKHSQAVSRLLLPGYAAADNTETTHRWQAALRSLTGVRRVVFPLDRTGFALDNDSISHGPRLWANVLGLMATHAWLEQRNREIMELPTGERAVVAEPDDYEVAHRLFAATSRRTVVNISDTHRKILDALYELQQDDPTADGFPQRAIAEQAGVQQGTVSKHKTFLTMSAKLVRETDHGLALVGGAQPSWWDAEGLMRGFPTPAQVRAWWDEENLPPDGAGAGEGQNMGNERNGRNTDGAPTGEQDLPPVLVQGPATATAKSGMGAVGITIPR